jgi:phage tail sheath gpL-like
VRVERAITTYQRNAFAQADASYLDSETLHQLTEVTRRLRSRITNKYPRHKLANDNTRFGAGQAIVTPSVIRGELIAEYAEMEDAGLVENMELFKKYLIVERNATNPNRLDVLLPPDLVNQLRVFAVLNQFRLQYPATA